MQVFLVKWWSRGMVYGWKLKGEVESVLAVGISSFLSRYSSRKYNRFAEDSRAHYYYC